MFVKYDIGVKSSTFVELSVLKRETCEGCTVEDRTGPLNELDYRCFLIL